MENHNQDHEFSVDGNQDQALFEESYICYPVTRIKNKEYLEAGNRIIMPPSALDRLEYLEIEYPLLFQIKNPATATGCSHADSRGPRLHVSHCGVLEFSAAEDFVYMPQWMMDNLQLEECSTVVLKYANIPKGTFMKIQPHKMNFIQLPDPKQILETALKNYACVTAGETIIITHHYNQYYIDILETNPSNAISVVETDCEVEFAPPLDYKEPEKKPKSVEIAPKDDPQNVQGKETKKNDDQEPKFRPFTGTAWRLDGRVSSMPPSAAAAAPQRTDDVMASEEAQSVSRKRPGKLMFGHEEVGNPPSKGRRTSEEADNKEKPPKKFQPFTGKKYTLSG